MKNAELWEQYNNYSEILSTNSRKLAFAAAAICWFFKSPEVVFPEYILAALFFIVGFFIADILQYLSAASVLRYWIRNQEKEMWSEKETIQGEYEKPAWPDYPALGFWWINIISLLAAYVFIALQII